MIIGVPTEIKSHEYRVGLTPHNVARLVGDGHQCLVQSNAGTAIGFSDEEYCSVGATIIEQAKMLYAEAQLIVKVKEPQPGECDYLQPGQWVFGFFHLAANLPMARTLLKTGAICIAYETVEDADGRLPLLAPMSAIAGRFAVQAGAHQMENPQGGKGLLLGGVEAVPPACVVIIGAGVVGSQAASVALGMGGQVLVMDVQQAPLDRLQRQFGDALQTRLATPEAITEAVVEADLVVGAVLVSGASAPKVIPRALLKQMKPGTVLVDVAIDQGGCFASSRPTTHDRPTFVVDGVIHYCVANIPGAVAHTATLALNRATFPYVRRLAAQGMDGVLADKGFASGVNLARGAVTHPVVAENLGQPYTPLDRIF